VTPPSHEEVATGDECAVGSHQGAAQPSDLVWCAAASSRAQLDHASIAARGPVDWSLASGVMMPCASYILCSKM
jgi:hypothetical protein